MTEMVYGSVPVQSGDPVLPRWWRTVDRITLVAVLALFGIGTLLALAASPPLASKNGLEAFYYVKRQGVYSVLALTVLLVTSMMSPDAVRRFGTVGFALAFVALIALPLFGTDFGKGATRWYSLGFMAVQPSEFLKPMFVALVAWFIAAAHQLNGPPGRMISLWLTMIVVGFLVMQPDFGQAGLILFTWGVMYFIGGASILLLMALAGLTLFAGTFAYANSEHFARRIDGFLSPDIDPRTQLGYATNAIQEGGFFGVGVGEGTVKWSLPDAHTDFIIAVAAEEFGLVLVLIIILLYMTVTVRSLLRLIRERDMYARLAGAGLTCLFAMQAFINLGVAVRILPAKGMTLPFISYGGSSLLASALTMGMLLALTRTRPQGEIGDHLLGRGRGHG